VTIGEASAFLGLARAKAEGDVGALLLGLQRLFYRIMGDVAIAQGRERRGRRGLEFRGRRFRGVAGKTEIPKAFVVPGEPGLGALLDVACSVVRRAERSLVAAGYERDTPTPCGSATRSQTFSFVVAHNADRKQTFSKG
jgi:cob(I)alamin adenosyltransferase